MAKRKKTKTTATPRQLIDAELAKTTSPKVRQALLRIRSKLPIATKKEIALVGGMPKFKGEPNLFSVRHASGRLIELKRYAANPRAKRKAAKKGGTSSTGPRITRTHK